MPSVCNQFWKTLFEWASLSLHYASTSWILDFHFPGAFKFV